MVSSEDNNELLLEAMYLETSKFFAVFIVYRKVYQTGFGGKGDSTTNRETRKKLENAVETFACGSCSHSISRSPKLSLVFLFNNYTIAQDILAFWLVLAYDLLEDRRR